MKLSIGPLRLFVLALAIGALVVWSQSPPAPKGVDAPMDEFSAGRALDILRGLNPEGQPHEIGSPHNELVRERVIGAFAALGVEARTETETVCRDFRWSTAAICAEVTNIIAPIMPAAPEGGGQKTLLLMAHYDSVGAGPGASDAGHAVAAILEVARIIREEGPLGNPIVALITDGEERGLFGAHAFFQNPENVAGIGAVINLEARGSRGQSFLFETSDDGAWLIDLFAEAAADPVTNSAMQAAYKEMPNDTDLSETLAVGVPGVNFAYAGHVAHYHTPLDNIENLDLGSLQHQGDNMLTMVRALGPVDLTAPPTGEALYIDVLSMFVLRMPAGLAVPLSLLVIVGVGFMAYRFQADAPRRWGAVAAGILFVPALIAAAVASGFGVNFVADAAGMQAPRVANMTPVSLSLYAGAGALGFAIAVSLGRWLGEKIVLVSIWGFYGLASLAASLLLTGASVLFLFPALFAVTLIIACILKKPSEGVPDGVLLLIAGAHMLLIFPLVKLLETMFGVGQHFLITSVLMLSMIGFVPLLVRWSQGRVARWRPVFALLALAVAGAAASGMMPSYDAQSPMRMNILHVTDERPNPLATGPTWRVSARHLPEEMRGAADFSAERDQGLAGFLGRGYTAPAPADLRPAPGVQVLEIATTDSERRVRLSFDETTDLRSLRLAIPLEAKPLGFSYADGSADFAFDADAQESGFQVFGCLRGACREIIVRLDISGAGTEEAPWILFAASAGLPPGGEALTAARPDWAVQSQWGDSTLVLREIRF